MPRIAFNFTIANANSVAPMDVLTYLQAESDEISIRQKAPPPLGVVTNAGFDFVMLLGVVSSVASIASLLWQAYDKFIGQSKEPGSNAGLIIQLTPTTKPPIQFWLGGNQNDRDEFIREFTEAVTPIVDQAIDSEYNRQLDKLMASGQWREPKRSSEDT